MRQPVRIVARAQDFKMIQRRIVNRDAGALRRHPEPPVRPGQQGTHVVIRERVGLAIAAVTAQLVAIKIEQPFGAAEPDQAAAVLGQRGDNAVGGLLGAGDSLKETLTDQTGERRGQPEQADQAPQQEPGKGHVGMVTAAAV